MRIEFLSSTVTRDEGRGTRAYYAGEVWDVPERLAASLIAAGIAKVQRGRPRKEHAVRPAYERAIA